MSIPVGIRPSPLGGPNGIVRTGGFGNAATSAIASASCCISAGATSASRGAIPGARARACAFCVWSIAACALATIFAAKSASNRSGGELTRSTRVSAPFGSAPAARRIDSTFIPCWCAKFISLASEVAQLLMTDAAKSRTAALVARFWAISASTIVCWFCRCSAIRAA